MTKTVMIWNESEESIKFVVFDKDMSHLNGIYIDAYYDDYVDYAKALELGELIFARDGKYVVELLDEFPVDAVNNGTKVIVAGFRRWMITAE